MTSVLNSDCECLVIENAIIIIVKNQNQQLTEEKTGRHYNNGKNYAD